MLHQLWQQGRKLGFGARHFVSMLQGLQDRVLIDRSSRHRGQAWQEPTMMRSLQGTKLEPESATENRQLGSGWLVVGARVGAGRTGSTDRAYDRPVTCDRGGQGL